MRMGPWKRVEVVTPRITKEIGFHLKSVFVILLTGRGLTWEDNSAQHAAVKA